MTRPARRRRRPANRPPVGAPAGTFKIDPDAPHPRMRFMAYGPDGFVERDVTDIAAVTELRQKWPVVWLNVEGLGDAAILARLGEIFHLHPLALADVVNVVQRPKVEPYQDELFIVARMATLANEHIESEQLSIFLGQGFVLTFLEDPGDCLDPVREQIRRGLGQLRRAAADHLAYAILDAVIDAYYPILEQYGERLDALEDDIIARPRPDALYAIRTVKRDLLLMRRILWPMRDALNSLLRDPIDLISPDTRLYLRDCYDHLTQLMDILETDREIISGLQDIYQAGVSNRMNEVIKVLTIIATIFIPLTFIAGVYGMNFDPDASPWNMPELRMPWGYPAALGVMAIVALAMLLYFWRKGWLTRPDRDLP